ncbi:hypothetical protein B0T18DRAFT_389666 [Schizothecium vesticola]|uniref:Uncharacterized protein n=1 Tax=Schizothecium vesticola TaxID=314040 RepID=A0AA40F353_9PEZI|nr:hypothetical protein B0T18DRAFT_389666 [Schizothecium vesticola]
MALAASLGPEGLIQLGVSLSDIALIYSHGRRLGNWLTAKRHDEDLFETLRETPEVILKRRGIVDPTRLCSRFPDTKFIYHGQTVSSSDQKAKTKQPELGSFSWLMVILASALDICLPPQKLVQILIDVFLHMLNNEEAESSLRLTLDVNIESWRSVGRVRGVAAEIRAVYHRVWKEKTGIDAIPQLNALEEEDMARFLKCLLEDKVNGFACMSAATFAVARAIEKCGITISTRDTRAFETQFIVSYVEDSAPLNITGGEKHHPAEYDDPFKVLRGIKNRAQIVSFPAGQPESMVHATQASRETINRMISLWKLGAMAAEKMQLVAAPDLPYSPEREFYYQLSDDGNDRVTASFDAYNTLLAAKSFPRSSQSVLEAVEFLTRGQDNHRKEWLEMKVGLEFLLQSQSEIPSRRSENMALWLPYQALVFGFYYKLLEPLISMEFLSDDQEVSYLSGLWGYGSTTFLAMCTQFGQELSRNGRVSRTHILYMLATMYAGRNKVFQPTHSRINMLGVLGPISVLALPLLRTSDQPRELARFAALDLPVVQLAPDDEGELYASAGSGISFHPYHGGPQIIRPAGSYKKWSVHSSMGKAFRGGGPGVVMVARCEGRLVGWFNPAAAETMFLSSSYCRPLHTKEEGFVDDMCVNGFEILDGDWQQGSVNRATEANMDATVGVVHSAGCPALRYAAAGFYGGAGEEIAIATDDIGFALGRVEGQDAGIIIA